jgi:hypothetical protein
MKQFKSSVVWGILLILAGLLFLLQNFGFLSGVFGLFWALAFGLGGAAFLYVFLTNRTQWWAIIPGCALFGLSVLIALDTLWPAAADAVGGTLFLSGIGLSFWVIFLMNREHWWAIIPGGVLFTLALVAGMSSLGGVEMGGVFFLGLGSTFGLLAIVPTPQGRMGWALIPAAVLGVMGLLLLAAAAPLIRFIWPIAVILVGLYLLFRALVSR